MSARSEARRAEEKLAEVRNAEAEATKLKNSYKTYQSDIEGNYAKHQICKFNAQEALKFFNEDYYISSYKDVANAIYKGDFQSGFEHFSLQGHLEGKKSSPYFSQQYYLQQRPDVANAVTNKICDSDSAFYHYIN